MENRVSAFYRYMLNGNRKPNIRVDVAKISLALVFSEDHPLGKGYEYRIFDLKGFGQEDEGHISSMLLNYVKL